MLAKQYQKTFPQSKLVDSHVLQVAIEDLARAFEAFFRRMKAGEEPGYPRFKSDKRWRSIGFKVDDRRLKVSGVGRIRVRWHRAYQGKIKTCRIVRKAGRWYVSLMCEVSEPMPLPKTGRVIGIDMGIHSLITTSDGQQVNNPRWYCEAQAELRRKQRKLARAKTGSHQRKKNCWMCNASMNTSRTNQKTSSISGCTNSYCAAEVRCWFLPLKRNTLSSWTKQTI